MGKTPSGRAGIYLSYKTFTYHKKTLNIFFFIFWSLNREIYQGGVTLVGQKKNLFCCWLRICAFTGLPQCFSTSCKHFTFTFFAGCISVSHCSLWKLHGKFPPVQPFGKDPFPLQTEQIPVGSWKEGLLQSNLSLFQWQLWVQPETEIQLFCNI